MAEQGRTRGMLIGVLVAAGFFAPWIAMDYGIVRLAVGLVGWVVP